MSSQAVETRLCADMGVDVDGEVEVNVEVGAEAEVDVEAETSAGPVLASHDSVSVRCSRLSLTVRSASHSIALLSLKES